MWIHQFFSGFPHLGERETGSWHRTSITYVESSSSQDLNAIFHQDDYLVVPLAETEISFALLSGCTANEGLVRIQYKSLVPIYVFLEMKLCGLIICKTEF
jgi:hypothetical protein